MSSTTDLSVQVQDARILSWPTDSTPKCTPLLPPVLQLPSLPAVNRFSEEMEVDEEKEEPAVDSDWEAAAADLGWQCWDQA